MPRQVKAFCKEVLQLLNIDPPSDLYFSAMSTTGFTLHWTNNSEEAESYSIEQDGVEIALVDGDQTSYEVAGLVAEEIHTYRIRGKIGSGVGPFSETIVLHADAGIEFNGIGRYYSNNSPQPTMDPETGSFVIEFDIKADSQFNSIEGILSSGEEDDLPGVDIYFNSGEQIRFVVEDTTTEHFAEVYADVSDIRNDGLIHRIACVYDAESSLMSVLLDGSLVGSAADASDMAGQIIEVSKLYIGTRSSAAASNTFHGTMYGMNWMNGTTTPTPTSEQLKVQDNSVLFYDFTEVAADIVDEVSGIICDIH